jgi:5-methylcytosine-specific restriction endonuclease McrA
MAIVRGSPVAWADFYKTSRWQRLRRLQLREHPLCKFCLEVGRVAPATVVDHIVPHRGDWTAFCTGKLQSLCERCHKATKRQIELRGYRSDVGLDGWPLDPNHPANRAR